VGSVARRLERNRTRGSHAVDWTYDRIGGVINDCRARGASEQELIDALLGLAGALAVDAGTDERDFAIQATNAHVAAVRSAKEENDDDDGDD
jgi:hypothetical protein